MIVGGVEARPLEDHAHCVEDLAQLTLTGGAFGQRGVAELLHDLEVMAAVVALILVGGHGLLVPARSVSGACRMIGVLPGTKKFRVIH